MGQSNEKGHCEDHTEAFPATCHPGPDWTLPSGDLAACFLQWPLTSPPFQGGQNGQRALKRITVSMCSVCAHRQGVQPTTRSRGKVVRTWQEWGWRVGQDRGHFPASEDTAGRIEKDTAGGRTARSQACGTACPAGSEGPEAIKWRSDAFRFVF